MSKKKVTMSDIAQALGISTVTVSKALANKDGVSQSLRQDILDKSLQMGYTCPTSTIEKKSVPTLNIGVILAKRYLNTSNSFYWFLYQQLVTKFARHNYSVILEVITKEDENSCTTPNILENNKVDGLIILGQLSRTYIQSIVSRQSCLLFLDFYDHHFDVDSITNDNLYGAYLLTQHLIDKGHKKIGYVGNVHATTSILDRYLGYYKCLIENNLTHDSSWIIKDRILDGTYIPFELPQDCPTAFVCNCDEIALNFINTLSQLGYSVPFDIAIAGFDNYNYSHIFIPSLTTIEVDSSSMAKQAVDIILHKINDPNFSVGRKIINCKLIEGDSTNILHKEP